MEVWGAPNITSTFALDSLDGTKHHTTPSTAPNERDSASRSDEPWVRLTDSVRGGPRFQAPICHWSVDGESGTGGTEGLEGGGLRDVQFPQSC